MSAVVTPGYHEPYIIYCQDSDILTLAQSLLGDKLEEEYAALLLKQLRCTNITYCDLKSMLTAALVQNGIDSPRIRFDDANERIHLGYTFYEMEALFFDTEIGKKMDFVKLRSVIDDSIVLEDTQTGYIRPRRTIDLAVELQAMSDIADNTARHFTLDRPRPLVRSLDENNEAMLARMLAENLVIGDVHHTSPVAKKFLMDNMELFYAQGVRTLFMEHLFYGTQQAGLNVYFQSDSAELPADIARYLLWRDAVFGLSGGSYSFTGVVKAAKKAGIRVVAADCESAYYHVSQLGSGNERLSVFNTVAQNIIEREKGDTGYIVFVGGAHLITNPGVLVGMADMLGCRSINVVESVSQQQLPFADVTVCYERDLSTHSWELGQRGTGHSHGV